MMATPEEHAAIALALAWMQEAGYSLVRLGERWSFAATTTWNAPIDVLRSGHWATPTEALLNRADQLVREIALKGAAQ